MNKVEKTENKGHFEVEYMDGLCGSAFHYASLDFVLQLIAKQCPYREVKSIAWVEDI